MRHLTSPQFHHHGDVVAGITAALSVGAVSPDVVAVETRKHHQDNDHTPALATEVGGPVVVSLPDRRLANEMDPVAELPPDLRPLPSVAHYDSLLRGTTTP